MAFEITISNGGTCDKCGKVGALLCVYQSSRHDKNIVYIHEACLSKAIDKAKKASNA